MKIGHSPSPPNLQREPPAGKPPKASSGNTAPASTTVTLSAEAQSTAAPAGLLKVQARLEALGDARTRGQGVALERISRNIARYLENQAPAPAPAPVDSPATDPAAELPVTEAAPPAPTGAPADTTGNTAQAPTDPVAEAPVDNTQALLDALDNTPAAGT